MSCGIYIIRNKITSYLYIGQATDIGKRWQDHIRLLEKGTHHSEKLQEEWLLYGPCGYTFEVVELCPKQKLSEKEKYWMELNLSNLYNTQHYISYYQQTYQKPPTQDAKLLEITRLIKEGYNDTQIANMVLGRGGPQVKKVRRIRNNLHL